MLVTKAHQGSHVLLCMWHLFTRGVGCHNTCHNSCHNITVGHTEALLQNDSHTHNCNGVNRQKELFINRKKSYTNTWHWRNSNFLSFFSKLLFSWPTIFHMIITRIKLFIFCSWPLGYPLKSATEATTTKCYQHKDWVSEEAGRKEEKSTRHCRWPFTDISSHSLHQVPGQTTGCR